jgi:glycosyltransferase involved in cell wall biosynthesis
MFFPRGADTVVLGVGRLSPEKGFADLLAAAEIVLRDAPRTGFLLIGDGPLRGELERAIVARDLGERVVLAGFRGDVDRLLPGADVLAQSSYTEGLPNVILEAAAARVAVVATAVGGTPEVVSDAQTGYLVPAGDPGAMAGRLLELIRSPGLRRRMGSAGRQHVEGNFSFDRQCADYVTLFREIAGRR